MSRVLLALGVVLLITGCRKDSETAAVESGAVLKRPMVAVVPLIDRSNSGLTWSVSQEITRGVRDQLASHEKCYLISDEKIGQVAKKFTNAQDPFGENLQWVRKAFPGHEFVVFMELVQHEELPLYAASAQDSPAELNMAVRLRVVDVRSLEPKIVLQEFVRNVQHIPRQFTKQNFFQVAWGHEMYEISPLGTAHAQLAKELSSRIEDYVLLSGQK